jgi:hypothetical protein
MPFEDHYKNWRLANRISQDFDKPLDHVLGLIKYGDNPGWFTQPSADMVFAQQPCPDTTLGLRALAKAFSKNVKGKLTDAHPSSIVDGPSTSPLAMMHAATFPLLKDAANDVWQIIYDCSNSTYRVVVPVENYSEEQFHDSLGNYLGALLTVEFPPTVSLASVGPKPLNKQQIPETLFRTTTVDFTQLIQLRAILRKWRSGRMSWIDLSPWHRNTTVL